MDEISRDLSDSALVASIEANLFGFFPFFGNLPTVETHIGSDWSWAITDFQYPLFNSILRARLDPEKVDGYIEAAKSRASSRGVPLLWWIGPATRPADLGGRLAAHGFLHEGHAPGMAVRLCELSGNVPVPSDLTIVEVQDATTIETWCHTAATGFEMSEAVETGWRAWFLNIGLNPKLRHFLVLWKERPVATASLFLDSGVAGIYNVATVHDARRLGIGAIITLRCLQEARAMGYRMAILHSSPMGVGLYRRLGFREYCKIDHYLFSPLPGEIVSQDPSNKQNGL
ncbi:MAG: N-acetyltransferase [Deltaproteobacteria bacterium HGW-Deltaproteobacteria-15]|jgi:ribosomal protein S18 acetylase RimI-like enzyme|nr:MAG: N-acetyltransferase [Deltaproteobacteria bacterium HGW-Deltaproteobacteria-15]